MVESGFMVLLCSSLFAVSRFKVVGVGLML